PRIIDIVKVGRRRNVVIDGHVFLKGLDLNAYIAAGMEADHENIVFEDALEKLRLGMLIKLRAPYVLDPAEFVNGLKSLPNPIGYLLVTDDVLPDNLQRDGHLDHVVRKFIEAGLDPVNAIRAASLYPAIHLRLYDRGTLSPGKLADIVLLKNLESFEVKYVFADGVLVAQDGKLVAPIPKLFFPEDAKKTVKARSLSADDFKVKAPSGKNRVKVRVIEFPELPSELRGGAAFAQSLITRFGVEELEVRDGYVDPGDLATIAVIERHGRSGNIGKGFIKGLGPERGAAASTVSHDSHNLVVLGRDLDDMAVAANYLVKVQGGVVVVDGGKVLASIELPVAGLMSEEPLEAVAEKFRKVREALREIGLRDHPYAPPLFFLALPVIPAAKITDKGLFDVIAQKPVSLFAEE
ncbi:MAG: adenine deaminase, partial [Thaumarchaeota archaeon]|nr:adenine deaminase [Nitrososphaerota archaeon]